MATILGLLTRIAYFLSCTVGVDELLLTDSSHAMQTLHPRRVGANTAGHVVGDRDVIQPAGISLLSNARSFNSQESTPFIEVGASFAQGLATDSV